MDGVKAELLHFIIPSTDFIIFFMSGLGTLSFFNSHLQNFSVFWTNFTSFNFIMMVSLGHRWLLSVNCAAPRGAGIIYDVGGTIMCIGGVPEQWGQHKKKLRFILGDCGLFFICWIHYSRCLYGPHKMCKGLNIKLLKLLLNSS